MSEPTKAVFLSYAREDTDAARRIADALRSQGLEVWFDQNELRGGDTWDAKIRQQINDCTLFLPIVSAHTQERSKGYFRLEWKLAVEQTHLMLEGVPFLAPIVIDDTPESGAAVPAEFMKVQWTHLPGALPTPQFVGQVKRLLEGNTLEAGRPRPAERGGGAASPVSAKRRSPLALAAAALVVVAIAVALISSKKSERPSAAPAQPVTATPRPTSQPVAPTATAASDKSVAVLAFANLSDDKGNEYFSDGISEELLNVLAKIPGLKVTARTSSFHFKGKDTPIADIAAQLGVAYVVEGSVRKAGDKVRITAQLIKAEGGFHVWSDSFTRDLKDIFAVQDEIAGLIAQQLQLKLGGSSRAMKQVNPEAYRLVLEGRNFWLLRTGDGFARAEAAFNKALALDPAFAEAHAGLADVWSIRAWYRLLGGESDASDDLNRGDAEAQIALRLDPSLAEPYAALGAVRYNQRRYAESEQYYQEALRLNPNYAFAHHWHAQLRGIIGHLDELMAGMDKAIELDPLAFITLTSHTLFLTFARRYEEAITLSDRALALRSEVFVPLYGNRALLMLVVGRKDEAVAAARTVLNNPQFQPRWWLDANALYVLRRAGFTAEAQADAERIRAALPARSQLHAAILAALGQPHEALELLVANGVSSTSISSLYYSEMWDEVRADPRFPGVIVKLGFESDYRLARETLARMRNEQEAKK